MDHNIPSDWNDLYHPGDYNEDEMVMRKIGDVTIPICPMCINHTQGNANEVHDCKNTYIGKDGHRGQCNCWSPAHGVRE